MQSITWRELHELAGLIGAPVELRPRYNLAPGQDAAIIRAAAEGPRLDLLNWGLIPPWAKDPAIANKLINARVETAAEKPSFRNSWRARRCLIPANGYYEWTSAGGIRQPWLIRRRDEAPLSSRACGKTGASPNRLRFTGDSPDARPAIRSKLSLSSPLRRTRTWKRSTTACRCCCILTSSNPG